MLGDFEAEEKKLKAKLNSGKILVANPLSEKGASPLNEDIASSYLNGNNTFDGSMTQKFRTKRSLTKPFDRLLSQPETDD